MSVVYCIPTANPEKCGATFARWKSRGYLTAALTDGGMPRPGNCDLWLRAAGYHGWPWAVNLLLGHARRALPDATWLVSGGDDMDPDPSKDADAIAVECTGHFNGTMGVMQPTGDDLFTDAQGRCAAERICGSPWMGREFTEKWRGKPGEEGVFNQLFYHFFADELLKRQTESCGILWQRKDLTHYHHHHTRTRERRPYLDKAQAGWDQDEAAFKALEKSGFSASIEHYCK